jgi:serine/threonine protein kinase
MGSGGMGVVYRARDERLERDVAVKVLAPAVLADERVRKRFRKEALTLSRLNHPNIAAVYDFVHEEERDFIVMELVPGPTLDARLAGGPLPQSAVLAFGKQLAEALAAAHQEGVIHRDLKPANLRFASDERLKVLDFGLAEIETTPDAPISTASFRSDSSVSGTLPYMAPEQLRGNAPDVRSDIYAAGAVLYEMATGKRAFPQGGYLIVEAIFNQLPQAPSQLNPKVSPGLENAIFKALDKNPWYRYQTARDLLAELERLTASHTGSVPRPAPPGPTVRRARASLILGTLLTLIVLTGLGWLVLRAIGRPSEQAKVLPTVTAPAKPSAETPKRTTKPGKDGAIPAPPAPPVAGIDVAALKEKVRQEEMQRGDLLKSAAEQEESARGLLRTIAGIMPTYKSKMGGYAPSLSALFQFAREQRLGGAATGGLAEECAVDPCMRGGYEFRYARPTPQSYTLSARPIAFPYTGKRSFYTDQSGVVHATDADRAATASDPAIAR